MNDHNAKMKTSARRRHTKALPQVFLQKVTDMVKHECNDLVPTNAVLDQLNLDKREDLGIQMVPLHKIVGSTGRFGDFDLKFIPRHRGSEARWMNVVNAIDQGHPLPPILLYKVGRAYFIEDGNHRVSVARAAGREWIQAHVIEIDSSALVPEPACQRLGFSLAGTNNSCRS
jgi:hypothetical protein